MKKIDLDISKLVQPSYHRAMTSRARDLVEYGGAGAGKSFSAAQKIILKSLVYPDRKIVITRKYGPALRRTCFDMVCKLLRKYQIPAHIKDADMEIRLGEGSQMLFIPVVNTSGEPAERIKSMTDITDMWLEECTELSFEEYKMIKLRLRGEELTQGYRQRIHTFNPIDKNHWLYHYFFEPDPTTKDLRAADRQKYTYKDNQFIDADYITELEALKNEDIVAYNVYALGEWGTLSNQIYTNYVIESFDYPLDWFDEVIAGADFGYENPSTFVLIGIKESTLYIIDEIYQRKLVNPELIAQMQAKTRQYKTSASLEIYADYAEPARIEEMRRVGMNVKEANKSVIEGINVVKKYKAVIHPRCTNFIKEIAGYRRKEDKNGNVLEDPVKFNDHLMDAWRYAVLSSQKRGGIKVLRSMKNIEF